MSQEINGWLFPDDVEPPDQSWYRMSFGDREVWDMDKHGHVEVARQVGLDSIETNIADSDTDSDGVRYAAVEATVSLNGETFAAVGGADSTSQQVRDPEHVWSVAETRALKRAIKRAVGIRPADTTETDEFGHKTEDPQPAAGDDKPEIPEPAAPPSDEATAIDDDAEW